MSMLNSILANKHTTIAGGIFLGLKIGVEIASVWFPSKRDQFKQTADILEGAAVMYGLAMAGDAGKGKADLEAAKSDMAKAVQTGNTEFLTKPSEPNEPKP